MNFLKKLLPNLLDLCFLKKEDVLIVSYPKSGNTWVRFLLCNYIILLKEENETINFEKLNIYMPEFGYNLYTVDSFFLPYNRIIKTHKRYSFLFRNQKAIYILRNPIDTLKSFFIYNKNLEIPYLESDNLESFIRSKFGISGYIKHFMSWDKKVNCLVKYEELQSDTQLAFTKILRFLSLPLDNEKILIAIEKSDLRVIKSLELKNPLGHKELLKENILFTGLNSIHSKLSLSDTALKYVKNILEKNNFNQYQI